MDTNDRRHAHLMAHLARFRSDTEFLRHINQVLEAHPTYKTGYSDAYFSQLKTRGRNIGPRTRAKLEVGLGLAPGAFDQPLPEELAGRDDPEFEALLSVSDPQQIEAAMTALAGRLSAKEAMRVARIFLDRAEAST